MVDQKKQKHMQKLINKDGIIAALAIDQRGALKKMMGKYQETSVEKEQIEHGHGHYVSSHSLLLFVYWFIQPHQQGA